jgi:Galactose oxidase, central domain/Kelch motif
VGQRVDGVWSLYTIRGTLSIDPGVNPQQERWAADAPDSKENIVNRLVVCLALIIVLVVGVTAPGIERAMASGHIPTPHCTVLGMDTSQRMTHTTLCLTVKRAREAAPSLHDFWSVEPSMLVPTTGHDSTLLQDGRLLVTGGMVAGIDLAPVPFTQIYHPDTRSWSFGPPMHMGRVGGTATLLQDGRVLVVGGLGARRSPVATAEIFDPVKSTWTMAAQLPQARMAQSASVLPDGRVLIVGGVVRGRLTRTSVVYDPARNRWSQSSSTHFVHALQSSVTLPDHRVMIAGGYGRGVEVFQPRTDSWSVQRAAPFRTGMVLTLLGDGTVLMASGINGEQHDEVSSAVFDPGVNRWIPAGPLFTARNGATGTILQNGAVLVTGGGQVSGSTLASAELYHPLSRTWSHAAPMHVARTMDTATPLQDHTVLACGGINRSGVLDSCERYHP